MSTPKIRLSTDVGSFGRYLEYRNRAPSTRELYTGAAERLARWLTEHDVGDWSEVTRQHIRDYITDLLTARSAGYASSQYRALQQFWKWWASEYETRNPMDGLEQPQVPEQPVAVLREQQLEALFKTCEGKDFVSRRDNAILRLFCDSGLRLAELTALTVDDVDLSHREVSVMGKGRRRRVVPFGRKAAYTLDRYLVARSRHQWSEDPALWLADRGRGRARVLTRHGIYQMVRRRGDQAGIDNLHPHVLRHSFVHHSKDVLRDDELMRLTGWQSRAMLNRYAASTADERAREAGKRHALGDRL